MELNWSIEINWKLNRDCNRDRVTQESLCISGSEISDEIVTEEALELHCNFAPPPNSQMKSDSTQKHKSSIWSITSRLPTNIPSDSYPSPLLKSLKPRRTYESVTSKWLILNYRSQHGDFNTLDTAHWMLLDAAGDTKKAEIIKAGRWERGRMSAARLGGRHIGRHIGVHPRRFIGGVSSVSVALAPSLAPHRSILNCPAHRNKYSPFHFIWKFIVSYPIGVAR